MFGLQGDPHFSALHLLSSAAIIIGFLLLGSAWRVLYAAQREGKLATAGPYRYVRHPQCIGFTIILLGFLLQWPTLLTLAMFPFLVAMYVHLAHTEEREVRQIFGESYDRYAAATPGWFPRLRGPSSDGRPAAGAP